MKRRIAIVLTLGLLGGGAWLLFDRLPGRDASATTAPGRPAAPAIPVVGGEVRLADVPIYLRGLGTASPSNSVLVRSRIDGQLIRLHFTEGQEVNAGDILAELDPRPFQASLAQAQAVRAKDQAQLENARLDLQRITRLAANGSSSGQQLDTARALTQQLEAAVKGDQAAIDMVQIQLDYSRIKAPIAGRTGTRLIDVGNIIHGSDSSGIVSINQMHPITVDFSLPADTLPRVRAKLREGAVAVLAEDAGGRELATGTLVVIDNQINTATSTIRYKARFDNEDDALWPGQFVNVRVHLETRPAAVTVPLPAVVRGPDGPYVYVIGDDRVVKKQPVTLALTTPAIAVIAEGLQPGQKIVVDGQYRIQSGSRVELVSAAGGTAVN